MIKRQDYRLLHPRSNDGDSSSASSSLGSSTSEEAESGEDAESSQSPGESSSPEQEIVGGAGRGATNGRTLSQWAEAVEDTEKERGLDNMEESVVIRTGKNQGVLRCRLCPKTICLSENTMRAHLSSKKHGRAAVRFSEGKLKVVLNSDGEEESADDGETHMERLQRTIAVTQQVVNKEVKEVRKKQSGRQRQRLRAKRKAEAAANRGTPKVTHKSCPGTAGSTSQSKGHKVNGHETEGRIVSEAVPFPDIRKDVMKKRGRSVEEGPEDVKKRKNAVQN